MCEISKKGGEVSENERSKSTRTSNTGSRRKPRQQTYQKFLGLSALGAVLPGSGLIAAGKRRIGTALLAVAAVALICLAIVLAFVPWGKLASYAGDRRMLLIIGLGLALLAVCWLAIALWSRHALEPANLSEKKRLLSAAVVALAASLVVTPLALGSRYAFTQRDLIGAISSDGSGGTSHTTPDIDTKNPWANKPRLNVLLLGGDSGVGRTGTRPDTQIVASVDTQTGKTTMISLPRNLSNVPFPADSPLAQHYPNGFAVPGGPEESMLNAIYQNVPAAHPEVFAGVGNPGADANKWAVEGALGIDIDYYVMVNLEGFEAIIDALGGIVVDVPRDIPWGNKSLPDGSCTKANGYIKAGKDQHLGGFQALWFARSRCGSDDYDRMNRQRCVMNAIVEKANPARLLTQYQSLAAATKDLILTDIPSDLFPPIIELITKVKSAGTESLTMDNTFFQSMGTTSASPNYDEVHARVQEILNGATADAPTPDEAVVQSSAHTSVETRPTIMHVAEEPTPEPIPESTPEEEETAGPVDTTSVC